MFATLLGCGLRRSELTNLTMKHVQQRDSRWCIVDLVGKHGRVRTIPMPTWTKNAIDAWTVVAGVTEGHLFRPVNRGDQVCGERMSEKVVWQMLKTYVAGAAFLISRRTICVGQPRSSAGLQVENWSRFNCCSGIRRSRRRSATLARSRIWHMRQMTQSS
jgi:integrase